MANALKTLFTNCADAIRETLPDVGKMSPNSFPDKIREVAQAGGGSGGDTSDLVKWVTFRSGDGNDTLLYKMPVLNGDTCKDPIDSLKITIIPRYEDNNNQYLHWGWVSEIGAYEYPESIILNNITEDKTVYSLMSTIPKNISLTYESGRKCYIVQLKPFKLEKSAYYDIEWDGVLYEKVQLCSWRGEALDGAVGIKADFSLGNPKILQSIYGYDITWLAGDEIKQYSKYPFFINHPTSSDTILYIYSSTSEQHTFRIAKNGQLP